MGTILYLECATGISGDMAVAALLDLGASEARLMEALASLSVEGFEARVSRVKKAGLDACDFAVELCGAHANHDHDMAYLHGSGDAADGGHANGSGCEGESDHAREGVCGGMGGHAAEDGGAGEGVCEGESGCLGERGHEDGNGCIHDHGHAHASAAHGHAEGACVHAHAHEHRGLAEIEAIIYAADISERAKEIALRIFGIVARAEAKAHGVAVSDVHFHEVGAVDSIVDAVAFAVCLDDLGIQDVVVECLHEGRGTVRCQHGVLPVPVPAVVHIAEEAGIPLSIMDVQGEFVTPTGAAIAAAVRTRDALPERFAVKRMGIGAGKRAYAVPSILRAMLIEEAPAQASRADAWSSEGAPRIWKLECEVDDCSGEALGFAMERLFAAGAREAHFMPVFMKKSRPAYQIQVICAEEDVCAMEAELFAHTTTIGVRRAPMERTVLPRSQREVETPYGSARVKEVELPDGSVRAYPEHESVAKLCEGAAGPTYQEARQAVIAAARASR